MCHSLVRRECYLITESHVETDLGRRLLRRTSHPSARGPRLMHAPSMQDLTRERTPMTALTQQTSSRRSWIRRAATATAIGAMAAVPTSAALAGEAIVGVDPTMGPVLEFPATPPQPTYQVKMVSFSADDESGWDWLGSDEPYFIMSSVGRDGTNQTDRTRVFGDVDSGDTRSFGAS